MNFSHIDHYSIEHQNGDNVTVLMIFTQLEINFIDKKF